MRLYPSVDNAPHAYVTPIAITAFKSPVILPGTINLLTTGLIRYVPVTLAPALMNTRNATNISIHL